jgi:hypothetical protein
MPYITKERREAIDNYGSAPSSAGELNYAITKLLTRYLKENYVNLTYSGINEVRGVLVCVGDEFYRRVAVLYEEDRRARNGDVFE